MMSPSQISSAIRAKKKLLKEGSEDAIDVLDAKNDESGEKLDENMPADSAEEIEPVGQEKDAQKSKRMEKVRLMMKGARK